MAQATAVMAVHINRTLIAWRLEGSAHGSFGRLAILDCQRLPERGEFNPSYLGN